MALTAYCQVPEKRGLGLTQMLLVMKFTAILLFMACLQVSATGYAQRITIHEQNASVGRIFDEIRQQTAYTFVYTDDFLQAAKKVTVKVTNASIEEVLDLCFRDQHYTYSILNKMIVIKEKPAAGPPGLLAAPPIRVKGKVTNGKGEPLNDVSVVVKGTKTGAKTDAAGSYTITVNADKKITLEFSHIGYERQTVTMENDQAEVNVVLKENASGLNDVVIIAYGKSSRREISNAIVSLSAKDVENIPVASPADAMVGLVAGADISLATGEPGSAPVIRIRGVGSIGAGNNPLFVVDGYPLNSADNFNQISPSDIQSIQILKDAAACAIYGSRGGNGIILITTKHGVAGKTRFTFNAYAGAQSVSKKVGLLNGSQFVSFLKDSYVNANTALPLPYSDTTTSYANTDWQKAIFKTGIQSNYQLSASGGSDASRYYISGSYFDQEGIVKGTSTKRYTLRATYDAKLSQKLRIGLAMAPTFTSLETRPIAGTFNGASITGGGSSTTGAIVTDALLIAPVMPLRIANGDYAQYNNTNNLMTINIYNPVATIDLYKDHTNSFRGMGTSWLEWDVIKGLTFKTAFGAEILSGRRNWYIPATLATASSTLANLSNPLTAGINAMQTNSNNYNWVWENTLNYNTTIAGAHKINALAGYASQRNTSEGSSVFGQAGTYTNTAIEYVTAAGQIFGSATYGANALTSVFGRLNYSYKEKYLLSAALRTDGSSRFGSDNRYATFPSVSAGWRMTEEKFMQKLSYISELKLRASYGVTGNNDIGDFSWQSYETAANYVFGQNAGTRVYGFVPNSVPIRNLTWETDKQVDAGFELGLFNNRVYLTADAYQRNTTHLLLNRNVPSLVGFTTRVLTNVGEVRNRGLEFTLTTQNTTGKLKWATTANISFNTNQVMALSSDNDQILFDAVFGYTSSIRVIKGKPLGSFYGYKQTGVYMSAADVAKGPVWSTGSKPGDIKYADVSGPAGKPDGKIDANDITYLGNALPKYTFGLVNTFNYDNFQFTFTLQGRVGGEILNGALRYTYNFYGKVNGPSSMAHRWRSESDPGDGWTPRAVLGAPTSLTSFSSHELFDASFLRIRNVSLRYSLPATLMNRLKLESLSFYATVQNLYTFSRYFGYSPEANIYNNSTNPTYGVDQGAYPLPRTLTFGLNMGF
jgi:TonB-linked SusC/RagA family outer membrane protein